MPKPLEATQQDCVELRCGKGLSAEDPGWKKHINFFNIIFGPPPTHNAPFFQGRASPAFSKPYLCLSDTRHFRHFRRFRGSEERSPCFQWVECKFVIFAVFVETAGFWQGTKTGFTQNIVCATPSFGPPEKRLCASFPGKEPQKITHINFCGWILGFKISGTQSTVAGVRLQPALLS